MYVVNIWVHPKYVVVVCKLQFIGEMLFVCSLAVGGVYNDQRLTDKLQN